MDPHFSSKIAINISLRNLPSKYLTTMSAIAYLHVSDSRAPDPQLIGHTQVQTETQDFDFSHEFIVQYFFEENQIVQISVYSATKDVAPSDTALPSTKELIGRCQFTLCDLVSSSSKTLKRDLVTGAGVIIKNAVGETSRLIAFCENRAESHDQITFEIGARDLDKKRCISNPKAVLEIYRSRGDHSWQIVRTCEVATRGRSPVWSLFTIGCDSLCCNDSKRLLRFVVSDQQGKHSKVLIGQCETTLFDIKRMSTMKTDLNTLDEDKPANVAPTNNCLDLTNPTLTKAKSNRYRNSGFLEFRKTTVFKDPSFLDFIMAGMNVRLVVAIDFTASNGDPSFPDSLHYIEPLGKNLNCYEKAILAIGNVLSAYDSDQMYPVWGFGAKLRSTNAVSHLFNLTFDDNIREVQGVQGILRAYKKTFDHILLSGPTMFSELIEKAAEMASQPFTPESQHYTILLIITDGVVNDRTTTINKIIDASSKPLSIIIIGVGKADFSDMHFLDSDDQLLSQNSKVAARDIVQFVAMDTLRMSETGRLAAEVLAEVPGQVESFMKMKGIVPKVVTNPSKKRPDVARSQKLTEKTPKNIPRWSVSEGCSGGDTEPILDRPASIHWARAKSVIQPTNE